MLLAAVIGGYTLIGGLGATFYVSYFNTALIFVLILMLVVEVFYNPFENPEKRIWKPVTNCTGGRGGGGVKAFFEFEKRTAKKMQT